MPPEPSIPAIPVPEQPLPFWRALVVGSRNWMSAVPAAAYEAPVYAHRGPIGPPLLLVSDPDAVGRLLLERREDYPKSDLQRRFTALALGNGVLLSEGATWRRHRRIMAPAFEPRALPAYAPGMVREAEALAERWRAGDRAAVDVMAEMSELTLAIISDAMFSTTRKDVRAAVAAGITEALGLRPGLLDVLPGLRTLRARVRTARTRARFAPLEAAVRALVAERGGEPAEAGDLLGRLVAARDDNGAVLSAEELRDQVVTIFFAGHETTAVALTWVWLLLDRRPQAEARLHAELAEVLDGRAPTAADVPKLRFTRAVIEETMRLYPPLSSLFARQAVRDDIVCGVRVKAGQLLVVSPWIIHRHRALWDRPDDFDPDRFLDGRAATLPRHAYLPFGAGPRICMGAAFAMMEAVLVLATLAQRVRLRLAGDALPELQHRATLRPVGGLRMTVEALRRPAAAKIAYPPLRRSLFFTPP